MNANEHVLVIAEAGVNHNGDLALAKRLAEVAKEANADIVKYQVFRADKLAARSAPRAAYQVEAGVEENSQLEMLKNLELSFEHFIELKEFCDSIGITFLATSFDSESTRFLGDLIRVPLFKIPSGELTNYPYLVDIASYSRPVIVSTGMADMDEIRAAVRVLSEHGAGDLTILHCNTQYPTPFEDVNLRAMPALGAEFDCAFGYSDHTPGIDVPIAAVALGAVVIEKHFTLDRTMPGPDHKASLEPVELAEMVCSIRRIERALGSSIKTVTASEGKNRDVARKSIVAARPIRAGELLSEDNLTTMRPGTGLSPMLWPELIGTAAVRDFAAEEEIER